MIFILFCYLSCTMHCVIQEKNVTPTQVLFFFSFSKSILFATDIIRDYLTGGENFKSITGIFVYTKGSDLSSYRTLHFAKCHHNIFNRSNQKKL